MNWLSGFFAVIILCSVQGSIVYAVFFVLERLKVSSGNIRLNYRIIKWIVLLYIFPVSYLIDRTYWYHMFLFQTVPMIRMVCAYFAVLWISGAVYRLIQYHREYAAVRKAVLFSEPCADESVMRCFTTVKEDLGIREKISVKVCPVCDSPFVFGIWNVCIIIPERDISEEMLKVIFIHELIHIRNGDMEWKYLLGLVRCIHWFNPLMAALKNDYEIWSESNNDLLCGQYLEGWRKYFFLMLRMRSGSSGYGDRVNRIYRRNRRVRRTGAALLTAFSICIASPVSVLGAAKGYEHVCSSVQHCVEQGKEADDIWTILPDSPADRTQERVLLWELSRFYRRMIGRSVRLQK